MTSIDLEQPVAGRPRRKLPLILAAAAALLVVAVAAVLVVVLRDSDRAVRLEVSADGAEVQRIVFTNSDRELVTVGPVAGGVELPWSETVVVSDEAKGVVVSARSVAVPLAEATGTLRCRVLVGDTLIVEDSNPSAVDCGATITQLFPE